MRPTVHQDAHLEQRKHRAKLAVGVSLFLAAGITPSIAKGQPSSLEVDAASESASTAEQNLDHQHVIDLSVTVQRQAAELSALRAQLGQGLSAEARARQEAVERVLAESKATVAAALRDSPKVSGSDGLTLSGFLEADMYVRQSSEDQLNTSTGAPLNDNRFALRRARFRGSIDRGYLGAILEIDTNTVNGAQARPMTTEVTAKVPGDVVPYVAATVGIFKIPYGFEIGQADYERLFAERSNLERALFPGEFDLGARIAGGWKYVRYALAVQNGEPLGESGFPGRDPNAAKDVVGRLGATAALGSLVDLQGGFSGLVGKGIHKGTPATKSTLSWQDRNENGRLDPNELIVSPGQSALPSQNFSRSALGADFLVSAETSFLGRTTAYAEITWAKNLDRGYLVADPYGPLGRDMRELGYYVALVQDLGRHIQAGVRYDRYDPDRDSTDRVSAAVVLSSQAVSTVALAVAARWRIGGLTNRLLLQYDVNRNHSGRNTSGLPTNLANNVLTLRAEAVF